MKNLSAVFTEKNKAEFIETVIEPPKANEVLTRAEYTVISGGTERACITGMPNTPRTFPLQLGYCGVGRVEAVGKDVTSVAEGDRVLVYHGTHSVYSVRGEDEIIKVDDDSIDSLYAAFVIIAAMGLGGTRRLELELGESAMVIGLGLLGMFSVAFCGMSGANPVIAADFSEKRRALAKTYGADFAFDPSEKDIAEKVRAATGGRGANGIVEVTGSAAALAEALDCVSYMGRISLLGCTRVSNCEIDYYNKVHRAGVRLIGAHNFVRPKKESRPHNWTFADDCRAILSLVAAGKFDVAPMVGRVVSPRDCAKIYDELISDPDFPLGTVFDWRDIR